MFHWLYWTGTLRVHSFLIMLILNIGSQFSGGSIVILSYDHYPFVLLLFDSFQLRWRSGCCMFLLDSFGGGSVDRWVVRFRSIVTLLAVIVRYKCWWWIMMGVSIRYACLLQWAGGGGVACMRSRFLTIVASVVYRVVYELKNSI